MVEVIQEGDDLVFNVIGLHKLWALTSRLQIPREHIRGARIDPAAVLEWKAWRVPGTDLPLLTAGTFHLDGKRIFWDVRNPDNAVVIDLDDENYEQLIIEVEDPDAVVALLSAKT
jgi:hypothetical protein